MAHNPPAGTPVTPTSPSGSAPQIASPLGYILIIALVLSMIGWNEVSKWQARERADETDRATEAAALQAQAVVRDVPMTDFDLRLMEECPTPCSAEVNYPAVIKWVSPGPGIMVKYPGAAEFVKYAGAKFTPPKGAKTLGRYEFAPVDKNQPALAQVYKKVWR